MYHTEHESISRRGENCRLFVSSVSKEIKDQKERKVTIGSGNQVFIGELNRSFFGGEVGTETI